MKILHLNNYFETPLYCNLLKAIGNSIYQFVFYPYLKDWTVNYNFDGYNIQYVQKGILNIFTRTFYFYKLIKQYYSLNRSTNIKQFDVIHAHTLFSDGGLAYILYKIYKIPYIVAVRNTDNDYFLTYKPWLKWWGKLVLKSSNKIICITPQIKKDLEKNYNCIFNSKIEIIPNGIDGVFFKDIIVPKHYNNIDKLNLLFIGRIIQGKNIDKLINYVSRKDNIILNIVGEGDLYIEKCVKKASVKYANINYFGAENDKLKLIKYYRDNDIFITTSYRETFGLVYIESMANGTPVIYSKGTGIDGLFELNEVGCAIDPDNFKEWDEAIEYIVKNYNNISENCINNSKEFDWGKIAAKYVEMYYKITIK